MRLLLLVLGLLCFSPSTAKAQWLDPDNCWTCQDSWHHFAAGSILDVVVRGPYVSKSWNNRAWKRVLLVAGIGATYEFMQLYEARQEGNIGQAGYGFSPKDLVMDIGGAVASEVVLWGFKKIL
jgi:hypothetical protein